MSGSLAFPSHRVKKVNSTKCSGNNRIDLTTVELDHCVASHVGKDFLFSKLDQCKLSIVAVRKVVYLRGREYI